MIRDRLLLFSLLSGSRMAARPKCTVKFNSRLSLSSAILRTDWHVLSKFKSLDIIPTINDDQSQMFFSKVPHADLQLYKHIAVSSLDNQILF